MKRDDPWIGLATFLIAIGFIAVVPPLLDREYLLTSWLGGMERPIGIMALVVGGSCSRPPSSPVPERPARGQPDRSVAARHGWDLDDTSPTEPRRTPSPADRRAAADRLTPCLERSAVR
jgi:hypothetical protein